MKEITKNVQQERPLDRAAFFFFDANVDDTLVKSPEGLYRSLVYQLIPNFKLQLHKLLASYDGKVCKQWYGDELRNVLESMFSQQQEVPSTIVIDALDECTDDPVVVFEFLEHLLETSYKCGARLSIVISSRSSFNPEHLSCSIVSIEDYNRTDIAIYVKDRFRKRRQRDVEAAFEPSWESFENALVEQASGIFLWVVLVVNRLLQERREGKSFYQLGQMLKRVPKDLEIFLGDILASYKEDEVETAIHLFQWVLISARPLSLIEWHHILAMIEMPALKSIRELKDTKYCEQENPEYSTAEDELLEDWIQAVSKGLVEVRTRETPTSGNASITGASTTRAGAGSFSQGVVVEFIHSSLFEFFITGVGFEKLSSHLGADPIASGHLYILRCCIRYALLKEMDDLRIKVSGYEMERRTMLQMKGSHLLDRIISTCKHHKSGTQSKRNQRKEADALTKDILGFLTEFKNKEELKYLLSSSVASPLLSFAQRYSNRVEVLTDSESISSDSEAGDLVQQLKILTTRVPKKPKKQWVKTI